MDRCLCCVMVCLLGLGLMRSEAFEVEVQDESKKICISASMKANFTIQYETSNGTLSNVTLAAPDNVTTVGSTCGGSGKAPLLLVNFGNQHSLSFNFTNNVTVYSIDAIIFTYNTGDGTLFPDAKIKGIFTTVKFVDEKIPINSTYTCLHEEVVVTDKVVQVYWNVSVLAYGQDVTSRKEFHCSEDTPTAPPPTAPTTHVVTTSNTTTTPATTTTQSPTTQPEDIPIVGNYSVSNGTDACLLASMGLQLNASLSVDGNKVWTLFNIHPNSTTSSGSCGNDTALLKLNDNGTTIVEFNFSIIKKYFYLTGVNVTMANASVFSTSNLSMWGTSVGNSFLCHSEQLIAVSEDLKINTYDVRVQPFGVHNSTYATAYECEADDSMLIPFIVGTALGVLIVIILIAYSIGRRKSLEGYQPL